MGDKRREVMDGRREEGGDGYSLIPQVPFKAIAGKVYVRVAVHVYTNMKDIERLAHAINDIRKKNQ
jgi:selenocysteine lyase/cysteine desulfurase